MLPASSVTQWQYSSPWISTVITVPSGWVCVIFPGRAGMADRERAMHRRETTRRIFFMAYWYLTMKPAPVGLRSQALGPSSLMTRTAKALSSLTRPRS